MAKLLKLTNDYVFKRIFGYSGDEEVTKILLRDILQTEVNNIELDNNTITEKDLLDDKVGILDIKASINKNIECDIEMQVVNQKDIEKRLLFYWSKIYSKTIKEGKGYENLKKSIVVLIADFKFKGLKSIPKYITKWNLREEEYSHIVLTDVLEIYIIELEKFSKQAEKRANKNLDFWIKFIKNPEVIAMDEKREDKETIVEEKDKKIIEEKEERDEKQEKELEETKNAIKKAKEKLEQISKNEHEIYLAELREKYIRDQYSIEAYGYDRGKEDGINIGKNIGKIEGKRQEKNEIAKKMLEQNVDIELIKICTGLTEEEINKLKE